MPNSRMPWWRRVWCCSWDLVDPSTGELGRSIALSIDTFLEDLVCEVWV
jgi:hypothetical protein